MTTKTDIRQLRSRDELDQIAGLVDQQQDALMRATNSELTPPLRMVASSTPDLTITVENSVITAPITGRNRTIPPIDNIDVTFTSGTVVLPASAGGTITVTSGTNQTLTMSASSFVKLGIYLQSDGDLFVAQGAEGASIAAAGSPGDLPGKYSVGYIIVETDGGSNVQAVDGGKIYQYTHTGVASTGNQDRNMKLISGGTWSLAAGPTLSWSASAFIQVPGLQNARNELTTGASGIVIGPDQVAYVDINRDSGIDATVDATLNVVDVDAYVHADDRVVFARDDGGSIIVGDDSFRLIVGESQDLEAGLSDQNLTLLGSGVNESTSDPDYATRGAANRTTSNSEGFADAIANIDAEIDKFFGQLQLREHPSDGNRIIVTSADQTMRDNTILSQEISNLLMKFDGAEIDFSTGEIFEDDGTTPLGVDFTPEVIPAGEYFWYSITAIPAAVNADNTIGLQFTVISATASGATPELAVKPAWANGKKLGMVVVQESGGGITSIVQEDIRQLGVGSGSGGEGGTGAPVVPADGFNVAFVDNMNENPSSADSLVDDTITNAQHNISSALYRLECDDGPTFTGGGTNITLSGAPSFTMVVGDIIYADALGEWRRITNVNSQTDVDVDVAFSVALAADAGMVSQAVWTKDLVNDVGDAAESTRPRDFYPNEAINQVNIDYFDSLAVDDDTPDFVDDARVVVSVCQEGLQADVGLPASDEFSPVFTRPNAPEQIDNYILEDLADEERLFMVFFCNPSNATVTTAGGANLIKYKVSFYEQEIFQNGGILDSAFCMSQGSGTPVNCLNPSLDGGLTLITLDWNYVQGINTGETQGDLEVFVNGQQIPRFVAGVTLDAYYTEFTSNSIKFHTDLSVTDVSIEVRRRQGTIDTTSQNAVDLGSITTAQYLTANTTLNQQKIQRVITDSSGGSFTITLPAAPTIGDIISIQDGVSSWASDNVTVDPNGLPIETVVANDTLNVDRGWIEYEYVSVAQGWITRV